jgi:hypothetical protein
MKATALDSAAAKRIDSTVQPARLVMRKMKPEVRWDRFCAVETNRSVARIEGIDGDAAISNIDGLNLGNAARRQEPRR